MSGIVIRFQGKPELTARENLAALIERSKEWHVFQDFNLSWGSDPLDFADYYRSIGRSSRTGQIVHLTNLETTRRGNRSPDAIPFAQPFFEGAMALIVEYIRTTGDKAPSKFTATLRLIEYALRQQCRVPNICEIDNETLRIAGERIATNATDKFTAGRLLERFVEEFLEGGRLTTYPVSWKNPHSFNNQARTRTVSPDSGVVKNFNKLPHMKSVLDLAGVFEDCTYPPDQITTAWFALAMFSPSRVAEILELPVDCTTEADGVFGLSWKPKKDGPPLTKFAVDDEWVAVARTAIARLTELGKETRRVARWYEENPGQLYLPPGYAHLRGMPLTFWEAAVIVGRKNPLSQGHSLRVAMGESVGTTKDRSRGEPGNVAKILNLYSFEAVENWVLSAMPREFPKIGSQNGQRASGSLFCLPLNIMRGYTDTLNHVPSYITYSQILHDLGTKPMGKTVFERHGLVDPDTGEFWKMTTHQPRHLLNTLAQSKFVSEQLIAFWSGRKSVKQNDFYNHLPQEFFLELWVKAGEGDAPSTVGPLADKARERSRLESMSYEDALRLELGHTISTRFGLCRHNYALTPCPKDKDCISCGENTFLKGDERHLAEARAQFAIHEKAEAAAAKMVALGEPGAEKWLAKHADRRARWAEVVTVLTDPEISRGAVITLAPPSSSQTKAGLAHGLRAEAGHDAKTAFPTMRPGAPDDEEKEGDLFALMDDLFENGI